MISWYRVSKFIRGPRRGASAASGLLGCSASLHLEVVLGVVDSLDQGVDLFRRRVEVRRCARRALHAVPFVRRLGAVMTGTHGDAAAVERLGDVVRVHSGDLEGDR